MTIDDLRARRERLTAELREAMERQLQMRALLGEANRLVERARGALGMLDELLAGAAAAAAAAVPAQGNGAAAPEPPAATAAAPAAGARDGLQ